MVIEDVIYRELMRKMQDEASLPFGKGYFAGEADKKKAELKGLISKETRQVFLEYDNLIHEEMESRTKKAIAFAVEFYQSALGTNQTFPKDKNIHFS